MITPRLTRLVRVPDLRAAPRAVIELLGRPVESRSGRRAVLVPTQAAAHELQRTLESIGIAATPDLLTRTDFYQRLHGGLPGAPAVLTEFEREVLLRRAARSVEKAGTNAPFRLRPSLIAEILGLYDALRRNLHAVDDFHRLLSGELSPVADTDRGAERLLRQADFLAMAFAEFERHIITADRIDEHGLRALLLEATSVPAFSHVIVTVADQVADPNGLWAADFDLLARLPGLERVDVLATERTLAAGFHQRLHELHLPGIEDEWIGTASAVPALIVPPGSRSGKPAFVFTCRDREEELAAVAREAARQPAGASVDRMAVVFQRPLPYLYLARHVFESAYVAIEAHDALPLAGEPVAAALDLILTFIGAEGTRGTTVALLGSPHWTFADPQSGLPIERAQIDALDDWFRETKYLGGWSQLETVAREAVGSREPAFAPALRAAAAAADELRDVTRAARASAQFDALCLFVTGHERQPLPSDPWHARHLRAREAQIAGLHGLGDAHRRFDDEPLAFVELAAAIRRWIEAQTFAPRTSDRGVRLLDADAAAFTDVDFLRIVGLVDGDWPERSSRSVFFPPKLLEPLGWPSAAQRLTAARARFHDLLRVPALEVSASAILLEDDGVVAPSTFIEEIAAAGLSAREVTAGPSKCIFDHERLTMDEAEALNPASDTAAWLAFRRQLPPAEAAQFHGTVGRREPMMYAVSRVERYLDCPFKYFAAYVLKLDEEQEQESGLTPQERGQFLHAVFERFFAEWNRRGRGRIAAETLEDAFALFEDVAERHLARLGAADRALERTYLLGSAVAPGLAERAFAFEIEHGVDVLERLLEHPLEGTFTFAGPEGPRDIQLRAKTDRIDLLEDGTLRVIDYKIGRAPKLTRALQLSVYATCAAQQLDGREGRQWSVSRAGYVAFKEKNAFVSLGTNLQKALAEGQHRFVAAISAIEEGDFPPRPDEPWLCSRCGYALVCRKDYVGDE